MSELNASILQRIKRLFNNQKRKEITEKYGAKFISTGNNELPPDIEEQWLNNIEEFEKQYQNSEQIKLLRFIGSPIIRNITDLSVKEIENEYNRIITILEENSIHIDYPIGINISEKYRFITEEILTEKIDNIRIQSFRWGNLLKRMYKDGISNLSEVCAAVGTTEANLLGLVYIPSTDRLN